MLDYLGIFNELNKKEINYIVCGAIAVNLHGIPRTTYDIDLLVEMIDDNIQKLMELLKTWGFKPKVPVDIMDFAKKEKREEWISEKNMKAFNFYNTDWAISEIDILIDVPVSYEKAKENIVYKKADGVKIPTIAIDDLIMMKENTNRTQDEADVRYLRKKS